jgi:hypothetical protein
VVLKKPKRGVENALEMQEAELYMNARVSRDTAGACATFLGVIRVDRCAAAPARCRAASAACSNAACAGHVGCASRAR